MDIKVDDYEKLGKFYLGRTYDVGERALGEDLVLYDSKDLVTHGVVLGMTGSGKTGLCLSLLEEAAIDGVPAIVIDPKGDIANLMLTFPGFEGADFRPWINDDDAAKKGLTPDEFAAGQAALWEKGLSDWGQGSERVQRFKDGVDISIYTPGSNAGIPVSILSSLEAPPFEVLDDAELFAERVESTVSSILSLLDIDADPLQSREHVFLSSLFTHSWRKEEDLSLEKLILNVQNPPFDKIGVLPLESIYPESKRFDLSMRINNLLAAPGFQTWLNGEPLDISRMLYTPEGKPRISIFSIAHLSDTERMFFVSLCFNAMLGWMRTQPGTTSLRALLYMDEIYGYLPPTANPPSKKPLMTMLKQARAFGLGVLLATQNPVDLDYKALSNIGSWFLGRLQTERDKARVLDGLEGVAASNDSGFNRKKLEQLLAGLGSRVFLLNNVHDDVPMTFHVRWVMSYLRGPMTRGQIRRLMEPKREALKAQAASLDASEEGGAAKAEPERETNVRPALPSSIKQYFLPITNPRSDADLIYKPAVIRSAAIYISSSKMGIDGNVNLVHVKKIEPGGNLGPIKIPPREGKMEGASPAPIEPCIFADLPAEAMQGDNYKLWEKQFVDYIYREGGIELLHSPSLNLYSQPGEAEGAFRGRLAAKAREERDMRISELREKAEKEAKKLEERREKAVEAVRVQRAQAREAKMSNWMTMGSSVLGSLLGRGRLTATKVRTSATRMSKSSKEAEDVRIAEEKVRDIEDKIDELRDEIDQEIDEIRIEFNPESEELKTVKAKPYKKNISVKACGLAWIPYYRIDEFTLEPAWAG